MDRDAEKLAKLKEKYGPTIDLWFSKHRPEDHREKYEIALKIDDMLCGRLKPSSKYRVDSLEGFLKKIFPTADYIVLSDSDDNNDNDTRSDSSESLLREIPDPNGSKLSDEISKSLQQDNTNNSSVDLEPLLIKKNFVDRLKMKARRQSICVTSIAEYSIKTQRLPPSSAYAKKSTFNKPAFSINYKEAKPIAKAKYDPKEEAIKLNNIKEKIYCKQFLKMDDVKKELKVEEKQPIKEEKLKKPENVPLAAASSEVKLPKNPPYKMRKRAKSTNFEVIELLESDEDDFQKIPILKTCRPIRSCFRPLK